jgi:hypothetical protein
VPGAVEHLEAGVGQQARGPLVGLAGLVTAKPTGTPQLTSTDGSGSNGLRLSASEKRYG